MPTYHYRCASCSHEFDQHQRFAEDALTVCPVCSGSIRRVIHNVGVVFKGSGWYITDNRAAKDPEQKSADKEKASDSTKPAAAASDSSTPTTEPKSDAKVPAAV